MLYQNLELKRAGIFSLREGGLLLFAAIAGFAKGDMADAVLLPSIATVEMCSRSVRTS